VDVVDGLDRLDRSPEPVFVVVGVFDGLHRGHAYLLEHLVRIAAERGARPMVITFDHHPDEILVGNAPPLLCDPDERLERLAAAGVDTTVVVHFDDRLRRTTYEAFVDRIAHHAPVSGFLMTPDAAFGYQRAGTPQALAELGARAGFDVIVVPPFTVEGRPVSSTQVRTAIERGDLATARDLLGRDHCVVGRASAGPDGTAVRFGLPVALPPDGRYRARLERTLPEAGDHSGSALGGDPLADLGDGDGAPLEVVVRQGTVTLPDVVADGPIRLAFVALAGPDAG
jgi:riboflavin kinase/FMN adenylyltransferase